MKETFKIQGKCIQAMKRELAMSQRILFTNMLWRSQATRQPRTQPGKGEERALVHSFASHRAERTFFSTLHLSLQSLHPLLISILSTCYSTLLLCLYSTLAFLSTLHLYHSTRPSHSVSTLLRCFYSTPRKCFLYILQLSNTMGVPQHSLLLNHHFCT